MTHTADPSDPVKVMLLDDHPVVTEGLRALLDRHDDVTVVATAEGLEAALATTGSPDVIVADLVLGSGHGADTVRQLTGRFPAAKILVLTMVDDPGEIEASLGAGARGYMLKEAAADELVEAVRRVAAGEEYVHSAVGMKLARARMTGPAVQLSDREQDVARLLALGHTNAEISELLGVSRRTVETYRARLLEKLGVRTRAELVRHAVAMGLVDLSGA